MITVRAALFLSGFLGILWTILSLFTPHISDVGVGLVVASVSLIGWGLCDWLERHE
jgi:hypothetical protein